MRRLDAAARGSEVDLPHSHILHRATWVQGAPDSVRHPFCQTPELGAQRPNIWLFEIPVQEPPGGSTPLFSFEEPNGQTRSEPPPTTLRLNGAAR
jgi:hypothetical protein